MSRSFIDIFLEFWRVLKFGTTGSLFQIQENDSLRTCAYCDKIEISCIL